MSAGVLAHSMYGVKERKATVHFDLAKNVRTRSQEAEAAWNGEEAFPALPMASTVPAMV